MQVKKSFKRLGPPGKEWRQWQENLTVLQMYETSSLKKVGKKGADLSNQKWVKSERLKATGSAHRTVL